MPIYFLLSIGVLLSVGSEPTPQAYFGRGALFYNALTVSPSALAASNARTSRLAEQPHRPALNLASNFLTGSASGRALSATSRCAIASARRPIRPSAAAMS